MYTTNEEKHKTNTSKHKCHSKCLNHGTNRIITMLPRLSGDAVWRELLHTLDARQRRMRKLAGKRAVSRETLEPWLSTGSDEAGEKRPTMECALVSKPYVQGGRNSEITSRRPNGDPCPLIRASSHFFSSLLLVTDRSHFSSYYSPVRKVLMVGISNIAMVKGFLGTRESARLLSPDSTQLGSGHKLLIRDDVRGLYPRKVLDVRRCAVKHGLLHTKR